MLLLVFTVFTAFAVAFALVCGVGPSVVVVVATFILGIVLGVALVVLSLLW